MPGTYCFYFVSLLRSDEREIYCYVLLGKVVEYQPIAFTTAFEQMFRQETLHNYRLIITIRSVTK